MSRFVSLMLLSIFAHSTVSSPVPSAEQSSSSSSSQPPVVSTVHKFPPGTWLENLAERSCGKVLTTELFAPHLWEVDPSQPASQQPVLVASITTKLGLVGITEYAPDVFAVIGTNATGKGPSGAPPANSIFSVDLNESPAKVTLLADLPEAKLLNGLTYIPPSASAPKGILLAADSTVGDIISLDLSTLVTKVAARDSLMAGCAMPSTDRIIGINGLKYDHVNKRVYFTNTYCQGGFLASIAINPSTGESEGEASIVGGKAQNVTFDDFDLAYSSNAAFLADAGANDELGRVSLSTGDATIAAGKPNTTAIYNPTAVRIGRTEDDKRKNRVYISTAGGLEAMVKGAPGGGQIVAVNLS